MILRHLNSLAAALLLSVTFMPHAKAVDVKLYGWVNKSAMYYADEKDSEFTVVDNNLSGTTFGVAGEQLLSNGLTASALFEQVISSNLSQQVTQNTMAGQASTASDINSNALSENISRVGLAGQWGAVFIGFQPTATEDAYLHDMGGVQDVMVSHVAAFGGGLGFRHAVTGALVNLGGNLATPSALNDGRDGSTDIQTAVRYNSPIWNGWDAHASAAQGGDIDLKVQHTHDADWGTVCGAAGLSFENANATANTASARRMWQGSVSGNLKTGQALTLAYFTKELANAALGQENPEGYYVKASQTRGDWAFAADWASTENAVIATSTHHRLTSYGLGAQYDMGHGVSLAGLHRLYKADISGTQVEDIQTSTLNLKVNF